MMNGIDSCNAFQRWNICNAEYVSIINNAILKRKFRICKRIIIDEFNKSCSPCFITEYAVQKRKKFLWFKWWKYVIMDKNNALTIWVSSLELCKKYIYNACVEEMDKEPKTIGILPIE